MKVTLTKHGGLAAGMRRPSQVADAAALPKAVADELARLVAAAKARPGVPEANPGQARDAMSYSIAIESEGESPVLRQSDTTMSPAFAALVAWLENHAPS